MPEQSHKSDRPLTAEAPVRPPFWYRVLSFGLIWLVICSLLEILLFNYASLVMIGGKYTTQLREPSQCVIRGLTNNGDGTWTASENNPTVEIKDLNIPVKTLALQAEKILSPSANPRDTIQSLNASIQYTDETRSDYIGSPRSLRIVTGMERTRYTTCTYYGASEKIRFTLQCEKGQKMAFDGVAVNESIPFDFSILRIAALFSLGLVVYLLIKAPCMAVAYNGKRLSHWISVIAVLTAFLLATVGLFSLYVGSKAGSLRAKTGDQLSQELVDAFSEGQVSLLKEPSPELLALENPYSPQQRADSGAPYAWDHLLYEGKYYSYYGIAPVLTLFLPYHLITGAYFPTSYACLLFGLIAAVFLTGAYMAMIRRWFSKTPFRLVVVGLFCLLLCSGIWLCVIRPMFYEAAELSGLMFMAIGVFFLFCSNIFTDKPLQLHRLALSATALSLAVMSRPTFAAYVVVLLVWFFFGLRQHRDRAPVEKKTKSTLLCLAAILIPFAVFGGAQMLYNTVRFGSPFEFGIRYSLTINDFTNTRFSPSLSLISIWNMLFGVPTFTPTTFPYFSGNVEKFGINAYYFIETGCGLGLFWRFLPLFAIVLLPYLMKRMNRRQLVRGTLLCGLPGLLVPLLTLIITWESGYALRYNVDFAWPMVLFAIALCFAVYGKISHPKVKKGLQLLFICCGVVCLISTLVLVFQHVPGVTNTVYPNTEGAVAYTKLARLLTFWY